MRILLEIKSFLSGTESSVPEFLFVWKAAELLLKVTGFRPEKPLTVIFHFIVINLRLGYTVIVRAKEKGPIPASRLRDCDYHVIDMYKITDTDEEGTCIKIFRIFGKRLDDTGLYPGNNDLITVTWNHGRE